MIAFACVLSNSYVYYMTHHIKSILKHNPTFNLDYYIICNPNKTNYKFDMNDNNREILNKLYPFKWIEVDIDLYERNKKGDPCFWSIELFKLSGYKHVVYYGADMLCLNKLEVMYNHCKSIKEIGMVRERRRPDSFNNGGMIVGNDLLNEYVYNALMNLDHTKPCYDHIFGRDQKLLNIYFAGKIIPIPIEFNTLVTEQDFAIKNNIVFLHYIHKPTNPTGIRHLSDEQLKIWHEYDCEDDTKIIC